MSSATRPKQAAQWNGSSGEIWVRRQETLDRMVRPLGQIALDAARVAPGEAVLDVGCGCGDTTLAVAESAGATGRVLGVDVSEPMLARAGERVAARRGTDAAPVELVVADAATHPLPEAAFDVLVSRFGVMFFEDPESAFANLARALRPGGRLAFVCWRAMADNPWALLPLRAVSSVAPVPTPPPGAPGPFAFADAARVTRILEGAGFVDVSLTPHDGEVPLGPTGPGTRDEDILDYLLEVGPAARAIGELGIRPAAEAALAALLATLPRRDGGADAGVWVGAAAWLVTARLAG